MIHEALLRLLKQAALTAAFLGLPVWWLILSGRSDSLQFLWNGNLYEALILLATTPVKDIVHATTICSILGGLAYHDLGWSLSIIHIPLLGSLDRLVAKSAVILGLVSLLVAFKLGIYN